MIRRVNIREVPGGWLVEGLAGYRLDVKLKTAAHAVEVVQLKDRLDTLIGGVLTVTTISWSIRTGIGRKEVRDTV